MGYKVLLHDNAVRALNNLDGISKERIKKGLKVLETDPYRNRPGADIKKLKGTKGREDAYRLRIGDYRAVYGVADSTVRVTRLQHRGEGYDWLN